VNIIINWIGHVSPAIVGAIVGLTGTCVGLRNTAILVKASAYGDLLRRVSDLEASRDSMGEMIYQKDRALISISQQTTDEKAGRASEKGRADRFEALSKQLQERLDRLESAVKEILNSPRLTRVDKERLLLLLETPAK
jgi:hypothetical protein